MTDDGFREFMMLPRYPYFLANSPVFAGAEFEVFDKFRGGAATRVSQADSRAVEAAIVAGARAQKAMRDLPSYRRAAILTKIVEQLTARAAEFADAMVVEVGKTIRDARSEVSRAIDTFRVAAEEATRVGGEYQPLDISERAVGAECVWRRFPVGLCSFITPFNFPLNLVAHKVAPAIAAGCPWILKPALRTPVSALLLGEILAECESPAGAFSILTCEHDDARPLVEDERIRFLSFTGSPAAGWKLKTQAGKKRVALELGGNAACIVDGDADLQRAAERITFGAFYGSGQSCISVQRVLIQRAAYAALRDELVSRAAALVVGDPRDEQTFIGPLIAESDAQRLETWINEAVAGGAKVLCGGKRDGATLMPTLLEDVPHEAKISCVEAFGPVATLEPFDDFDAALAVVNDSEFGLQAGIFTNNIHRAFRAFRELEVGGVVINDVPSFRVDSMPYGGIKASGVGREGVRFALEEMTEIKCLVLSQIGRQATAESR